MRWYFSTVVSISTTETKSHDFPSLQRRPTLGMLERRMWVNMSHLCSLSYGCCCRDSSSDGCGGGSVVFAPRLGEVAQLCSAPMVRHLPGVLPDVTQTQLCWRDVPMDGMGKRKWCRPASPPAIAALFPSTSTSKSHFPRPGCRGELWMPYWLAGGVNALLLVPAWSAAAFSAHLCSLGPAYPA